jgi:multidrug efflux pump subunit AcrA (membrane-fusion protein)
MSIDPCRPSAFSLAICIAACAAGCGEGRVSPPPGAASPPRRVAVVPVAPRALPGILLSFGTLHPDQRVRLAFLRPGRVDWLGVDVGAKIRAGQSLARLDTSISVLEVQEAEAAVQQVRARLELPALGTDDAVEAEDTAMVRQARAMHEEAQLTLRRAGDLLRQDLTAQAVMEAAQAAAKVAESRLQQARTEVSNLRAQLIQRRVQLALARERLRESELTAPFDGYVAERMLDPQELVAAGQVALTVLRTDTLRLRLEIPERDAAAVRVGQRVLFHVDGAEQEREGRIARLGPNIQIDTRTLRIEAEVQNVDGQLRPGSFVRARIEVAAPALRMVVPAAAVVTFAGVARVFVVQQDKVHGVEIDVGRRLGEDLEVLSGLDGKPMIIADPSGLVEGQPVTTTTPPVPAKPNPGAGR